MSSSVGVFVVGAGVDPTVWVEELGRESGITQESGRFMNISMGQGQELPAEAAVQKFARSGGWIMLQVPRPLGVAPQLQCRVTC